MAQTIFGSRFVQHTMPEALIYKDTVFATAERSPNIIIELEISSETASAYFTSNTTMSSKVLVISNLPFGTKPNTVYAQFDDKKYYQDVVDIYTHPGHKGQAWVIFSSPVAARDSRRLFGTEQKYYTYLSCLEEIPFNTSPGASKVERYTDFVAKKDKEKPTSTLLITGLTSKLLWEKHLDDISPRGLEHNTAYCEKDISGDVKVQFLEKDDAERTWEKIKEDGMHGVYNVTARFVDDVYDEEEAKGMQNDGSDDDLVI